MKILLIEDDPADRWFVSEQIRGFEGIDYELVVEDRLDKGLAHFTDEEIAVILLDLNLPDSRGLDTFTTVHRLAAHIPIIILTGIDDDGLALKAVEGGAQDYLIKGQISSQILQKAVQYAVERHRILQDLEKTTSSLKREEEIISKSEALYRTIFETTGAATAILDENGTIIHANSEAEAIFGYSPGELEGKMHWSKFVSPEELPRLSEYWHLLHEDPNSSNQHYGAKLVDRWGRIRYGVLSVRLIPHTRNSVVSITEITERKRTDEIISESEERFRGLFDHMSSGVAVYQAIDGGKDFIFQDFNQAAEKIEGVSKKDLIGKRVTEVFLGVKQFGLLGVMQRVWKTRNPEYHPPSVYHDERTPASWRENWVYGLPTGEIVAVYNEISNRIHGEKALRESEEKFRTVVENVPDIILVHRNGLIEYVNNAARYTLGLTANELLGKSILDFIVPEYRDRVKGFMERRQAGEWIKPYEIEIQTKSGRRTVVISGNRIGYEGKPATLNILTDITDRKKVEAALQESEEKYRNLVDRANDGIAIVQGEVFKYSNPCFARIWGGTMDEIINLPLVAMVHPDEREKIIERHRKRIAGEEVPGRYETVFLRKDGSQYPAEINVGSITYLGRPATLAIVRDITERKQAEVALTEAKEKYRNIVEFAVEGIYQISTKGQFLTANTSFAHILGYDTVEDLLSTITDTARQLWVHQVQRLKYLQELKEHRVVNGFEAEYFRKDKSTIWVSLNTRAVQGPNGKVLYSEGTVEDITRRKQAENALRESEEMFRNPVESSPVGVFLVQNGNLLYANSKLAEMGGYSRDELIGHPFGAMIHSDDRSNVEEVLTRLLRGDVPAEHIEFRGFRKDGTIAELEAYGSPMLLQGLPAIYGTIIDVTERKRMADQLQQSLKEKEVLLREIHHRVKNNMQVISSLLSMQSQNIKDDPTRGLFRESQNRIRSIALVHELLYRSDDLSQIEYGAYLRKMFIPLFESYSIDQRKVTMAIEAQNVMITIEKAVPCSLIVNELISNSLKHAFPGDRKGKITVGFGIDDEKQEYVLDYSDNGVGLPQSLDINKLTSLGMRLITGLTKQLGGTIEIQNREGAYFRISFPAASLRESGR